MNRGCAESFQRMLEVMLTSSSVDAPATVLWTRTTAMSITAAVTLAQMKPMMRSAALSAIDPVLLVLRRFYTGHLLPDFFQTYFLSETLVKPVSQPQRYGATATAWISQPQPRQARSAEHLANMGA